MLLIKLFTRSCKESFHYLILFTLLLFKQRILSQNISVIIHQELSKTRGQNSDVIVKTLPNYKLLCGGGIHEPFDARHYIIEARPIPNTINGNYDYYVRTHNHCTLSQNQATSYGVYIYDPEDLLQIVVEQNTCPAAGHPVCSVKLFKDYIVGGGGALVHTSANNFIGSSFPCNASTFSIHTGERPDGWCANSHFFVLVQ